MLLWVIVGGAAGGGFYYYKKSRKTGTEYQTAVVTKGDLVQAVTATGQLNPVVNVQVGSQISGIVKKLYADYNSVVKSNQLIAEIDPSTYQLSVLRAEAQVANAKANLKLAEVQASRAESLFNDKLISASEHDTTMAQLDQAKANLQSDEAALQTAKVQLAYCTIYAPVDGVVITRSVDVGQTVAASFNTPTLYLIANDLTKMQIDALVSEADIGGVSLNQNVTFMVDAYPYRTFRGKVSQIRYGAFTNQNVVNYDCVVGVNNDDLKLLPGMTANVSIIIAERTNTMKVPNAALRFRPPDQAGQTNAVAMGLGRQGGDPNSPGGLRQGGGMGMAGGRGPGGPGMGGGGGGRRGGGGEGGEGGFAPGMRQRSERQLTRTVYLMPANRNPEDPEASKLKPVQVKVGISDGVNTEVLEGLNEGDQVVVGVITPSDAQGARPGAANPFGGGFRRF